MALPAIGAGTALTAGWIGADVFNSATATEETPGELADAIETRANARKKIAQTQSAAAILGIGILATVVIVVWS